MVRDAAHRMRQGSTSDLEVLWRLEKACFGPDSAGSRRSLRRSLQSPRQSVWLVEGDGGRAVAFIVVGRYKHIVRVTKVATHPDFRGRGLADRLMEFAEDWASQQGARGVVLHAPHDRVDLLSWFAKRGYRQLAFGLDAGDGIELRKDV